MSENKTFSCSMTRANKILSKVRELKNECAGTKSVSRYSDPPTKYTINLSFLTYKQNQTEKTLDEIVNRFNHNKTLLRLFEKIKNRIFTLNIRYGIHDLLTEVDMLKHEKKELQNILNECNRFTARTLEDVKHTMEVLKNDDKKYEYNWSVIAFNPETIQEQVKAINKKLSVLDNKRDSINISSTFSIELTPEEYELLELDE